MCIRDRLKSIKFKLPIIEEDMSISLDNEEQVETVALLERMKVIDVYKRQVVTTYH